MGSTKIITVRGGIDQFMNCATLGTERQNCCEIVPFTKDSRKLFTRYGERKVVSTDYVDREFPVDLKHTIQKAIGLSPHMAHGVVYMNYYGYSYDRLWEFKTES